MEESASKFNFFLMKETINEIRTYASFPLGISTRPGTRKKSVKKSGVMGNWDSFPETITPYVQMKKICLI